MKYEFLLQQAVLKNARKKAEVLDGDIGGSKTL